LGYLRTRPHVIIVDLDVDRVSELQRSAQTVADVDVCADFASAHEALLHDPPDFLVTNIRLGANNGLHLVHLASGATRCIVYMDPEDPFLLREAQRLGAFVEPLRRLPFSLRAYMRAELPARDRRDPLRVDRRIVPRGGRRAADVRVA
jgi:hypothetical protein